MAPTFARGCTTSALPRMNLRLMQHNATQILGGSCLSCPERINLGLVGVGGPDLLYATTGHKTHMAARRIPRQAVVLTCCAMHGDDVLLADGDVHKFGAERAVRQRPQE